MWRPGYRPSCSRLALRPAPARSTAYVKDPDDPAWNDDAGVKGRRTFMTKYLPEADLYDTNYVNAYNSAMVLQAVLKASR